MAADVSGVFLVHDDGGDAALRELEGGDEAGEPRRIFNCPRWLVRKRVLE